MAVSDGKLDFPEVALGEFNDFATPLADEVMVVTLAAQAIGRLAFVVADHVDESGLTECPERPVHRREAELRAERSGHPMDLRGAERTRLVLKGLEHRGTLGCSTEPPLTQPFDQSVRHGHCLDDSVAPMRAVVQRMPRLIADPKPEPHAS